MAVLPQQPLEMMSPFQGFAPGWWDVGWALPALAELPSDVLDGLGTIDDLTSQRMGGLRHVLWRPVSIEAFERLSASDVGMFAVALSGDRKVAGRIEAWKAGTGVPLLHVTSSDVVTDLPSERLDAAAVIGHCRSVHASRGADLEPARREVSEAALRTWVARPLEDVPLKAWGHNLTTPNHMALKRCHRLLRPAGPLPPGTAEDYDAAILDSARAVMEVRERAGFHPVHRLSLIHPEVYLVEPALFRHVYGRMRPGASREAEVAREVLRVMQAQRGFLSQGRRDTVLAMLEPGLANTLLTTRMLEVRTFTYGVGLAAAQTSSAVVRLSPAINHVFPALSAFGRSVQSRNFENRRKALRLFRRIQADMVDAVGPRRMQFLEDEVSGPVKIVSDAPVEWLPIGRLPLMIRHQCSRLNATPGNLLMGELSETESVSVTPDELRRVLVVSAFTADDPIRHDLTRAMERNRNLWDGQVDVTFVRVDTVADFMVELNRFSGSILVFDGHGALEQGDGIGKSMIGAEALDVWDLRGKVRTPPIVVLSACDTQGLDSPSHATVGNGFLALGAVTVVATLLPVGGSSGALFIARLMHRLAEFVPAVLRSGIRVLNWTEVVTGMQRMAGATRVVLATRSIEKRRLAERLGATASVDPSDPGFEAALLGDAGLLPGGADKVIEAAGVPQTIEQAPRLARRGGTVLVLGVLPQGAKVAIEPFDLLFREVQLLSSFINPFTHARAADLIASGAIQVEPLISRRIGFDDAVTGAVQQIHGVARSETERRGCLIEAGTPIRAVGGGQPDPR